jgi:type IV pilus assembly protein PilA
MKLNHRLQRLAAAQRGQGMTEYIIIVALIAIAAIGVYTAFGGIVRGQTGVIASELAGAAGTAERGVVTSNQGTLANTTRDVGLATFEQNSRATAAGGGAANP